MTTVALILLAITARLSAQNTPGAAVVALNASWKQATFAATPVKPGTVTPARTFTDKNGRVHKMAKLVQTKKEYDEEVDEVQYEQRKRGLVLGFEVSGRTVTVKTNLTRDSRDPRNPMDARDAQELCHDLGAFVWARENRHFGLDEIKIVGARGELLSSRNGLAGRVQ